MSHRAQVFAGPGTGETTGFECFLKELQSCLHVHMGIPNLLVNFNPD